MLTLIMTCNMILSITFIFLNHPLSLGLILLMQTTLISLMSGNFASSFWFSYILFLILIGGMLILFMYMTSIASNEKFYPNIWMIIPMMMILPLYFIVNPLTNNLIMNNEILPYNKNTMIQSLLIKYSNFPMMTILISMILYLLITLIATVKITEFKQGPIRQMN
uniref:NADH-ubiquinone oxidoreductase chain 6 n=1 Tax=Tribolium audax TaxID=188755 RepID=A0A068LD01_TRIAU|nr:NADH dehydrogenase subunit 6 [Tribolium audax]AIE43747.2 NADH dehydrogenase subunit 6 [Tribolium audax]